MYDRHMTLLCEVFHYSSACLSCLGEPGWPFTVKCLAHVHTYKQTINQASRPIQSCLRPGYAPINRKGESRRDCPCLGQALRSQEKVRVASSTIICTVLLRFTWVGGNPGETTFRPQFYSERGGGGGALEDHPPIEEFFIVVVVWKSLCKSTTTQSR